MILNYKKLRKLKTNPKLFFKDSIEKKFFWLNNVYKKYLPKKYKGFAQYAIISSVYNVEEYLDDYFNSIINQRLDFEKNIFIILVDDGSTDNSANLIKKYQKKYPKNIIYIYKENGGLSSARNSGLKYIQENNYKTHWITFTDPDDFLDRNYFYEVDKFLATHYHDDICMIGCNLIFYYEMQKIYKDEHPLNFKFKKEYLIKEVYNLNNFIQLGVQSAFFPAKKILTSNLCFDEKLRQFNEDLKFTNQFLIRHEKEKVVYISKAQYFYRKRSSKNSIIDQASKNINLYLQASKLGTLDLLIDARLKLNRIPLFVQYSVLYHFAWQIRSIVNNSEKLYFMSKQEKQEYLDLLDKNFSYIDSTTILDCNYKGFYNFEKKGILNCFKNEKIDISEVYIERIDYKNKEILLRYYTDALNKNIKIEIDGIDVIPRYKKDKIHNFLDRIFLIEKKMWIKISNNNIWLKCSFENSCKNIVYNHKRYNIFPFAMLEDLFQCDFNSNNCWIFIDRPLSANDNAEHLYRYIMQNHPEQNIVFALKRDSTDWDRLKKEGFNLIDFDTEFQNIFLNSKVLIASHNYKYYGLKPDFFKNRKFIFLQHGVTQNGLYGSFNEMRADLITVATNQEYHAIAYDPKMLFNYTDKDTFLTGFARHDYLYNNKCQENLKTILIFFTWRSYLNNNIFKHDPEDMLKEKFLETAYFLKIQSLLLNEEIKQIIFELNYKIKIYFHQEVKPYLNYFEVPDYIEIAQNEN
ncbi:glycosyltransferase, partial [Campylobacter jejuni]